MWKAWPPENMDLEHEWVSAPPSLRVGLSADAALDRRWRELDHPVVDAEVKTLISENIRVGDTIIYTGGSVIRSKSCD